MTWITIAQYVGPHALSGDWTPENQANATDLLKRVNALLTDAASAGVQIQNNPATGSLISGSTLGGFRPLDTKIGATRSTHKIGKGIDLRDADRAFKNWCMSNLDKLEARGLYMEHPDATPTWTHLQSVAPRSGNRVFKP